MPEGNFISLEECIFQASMSKRKTSAQDEPPASVFRASLQMDVTAAGLKPGLDWIRCMTDWLLESQAG